MPPLPPGPKMKAQIFGAVRDSPNPQRTYALAHSARCKLNIAADQPHRNLRMVLGHSFTLDNLLVRIVEIENDSAANEFDNAKSDGKPAAGEESEIAAEDDKKASIGGGASVTVAETGDLRRPQHAEPKERRVSFGNSANFRPSDYSGAGTSTGGRREKSPPPAKRIPKGYSDEESTSSDDYDEAEDAIDVTGAQALHPNNLSTTTFDDVPAQDPYEEQEEDPGLGLTRFASASNRQPRKAPSPPPIDEPPELLDDDEDEEAEDRPEPPSPPQIPAELVRHAMEHNEKDEDLGDLYETLRGCTCRKQNARAPKKAGVWRVNAGQDGKQYAVLAEDREALEVGQ